MKSSATRATEEAFGSALIKGLPLPLLPADYLTEPAASTDGVWRRIDTSFAARNYTKEKSAPKSYSKVSLNRAVQTQLLRLAPMEFTKAAKDVRVVITLPMPDGTFTRFHIEESPVMDSSLAARFPQIKTYKGQGIDDPTAIARLDSTPAGFHAIVLSAHGTIFIAPASQGNPNIYLSYDTASTAQADNGSLLCSVTEAAQASTVIANKELRLAPQASPADSFAGTLRTYRLAVAATAEYTQVYGGGTTSGALAAITTVINQVNAIYERDLAIRLILINGETNIIFTNATTDGYTSDDVETMQTQNQSVLDTRIGAGSYDIGHVFDGHNSVGSGRFFFQGRADVASVCVNGRKGKGATIFRLLEPSAVNAVYVVAHEMGHQFGATHTFNGTTTSDCLNGRVAGTAFEPGTGSTIMAYRGSSGTNIGYFNICGEEDLHSTDLYFHIASISQIINYTTTGGGASCAGIISTGDNAPTIDAGADYTIPRGTPFTLTATGSDPEGDALTYCWEEVDLGAPAPPSTDDGSRPIFRSFAPTTSPSRTFPQLSDVLSGTSTFGESLPVTTRAMNFRVTLRDNHSGGGGGSTDAMIVNVVSGSGPFVVTQPASSATWPVGSTQTVTWDVANTSRAPVSCANVRILLSVDGGLTFPIVLNASTPNDGSETIVVPDSQTSTARVKVEAVGNIFFDISDANFSITAGASPSVQLASANFNVNENDPAGFVTVNVTRAGDASAPVSVNFATSDAAGLAPCPQANTGKASERCDYATSLGTLSWAAGESGVKSFNIPLIDDKLIEGNEAFTITLFNSTSGVAIQTPTATVTIMDDDTDATAANPIDGVDFFITQLYIDFLNRLPDQTGFNNWHNTLAPCPNGGFGEPPTSTCDRLHVAAGFFQSDEFLNRGYWAFRFYQVGFGRRPNYAEFIPDMAQVGGPKTPTEENASKAAFADAFVQRPEFTGKYGSLSGQALADELLKTAGLLGVVTYNAGSNPKGQILRDIAETNEVFNKFLVDGTVAIQYFAFLRRDPDAMGYKNNVDTLNANPNNLRHMIFIFIYSDEYRGRFGKP